MKDDEDTECLYCHDLYSELTEGWITCQSCGNVFVHIVFVQEWKMTMMKLSIPAQFVKMMTFKYSLLYLT